MERGYHIESARETDLAQLPAIERAASALFPPELIPELEQEPTEPEELRAGFESGTLWVARAPGGAVVGFALVTLEGGAPHLDEIDVHPEHGRRGVGRALVETVQQWARAAGHRALTLTTFRGLPFNQPFYESCGFRALSPQELSPALAAIVRDEHARGFDVARRVAMRCDLAAHGRFHHVDLTVCDLARSTAFYDGVLPRMGFLRAQDVPEGPIWAGAGVEIGLVAARSESSHDRFRAGLHHLALRAPSRADVDAFHAQLVELGVRILDAPADYPQYAPGYYAVFFADPDGLKLEYVFTP
jgi:GNAT superfamily N-acetyltransferase/catechol 2,3-dioxygenase-like lactoylglutathione lyase family enzyme